MVMKKRESSKPLAGSAPVVPPATEGPSQVPARKTLGRARTARSRDNLVLLSMSIVTVALGAMLYIHFGIPATAAILYGFGAWAVFMLIHRQVQKSGEIALLRAELMRLEAQVRGGVSPDAPNRIGSRGGFAEPVLPNAGPRPSPAAAQQAAAMWPQQSPRPTAPPAEGGEFAHPIAAADMKLGVPVMEASPQWQMPAPQKSDPSPDFSSVLAASIEAAAEAQQASAPLEAPLWSDASLESGEPIRDQWAFRPRRDEPVRGNSENLPGLAGPVSTIETDLAIVQQKIKALAEEVNAADAIRAAGVQELSAPKSPPAAAIDASIGALKATAATMRDGRQGVSGAPASLELTPTPSPRVAPAASGPAGFGDLVIPATAERIATSTPQAAPAPEAQQAPPEPAPDLLELVLPQLSELNAPPPPEPRVTPHVRAIANAIETGRMDVFLSPIVGLSNHAISHYEVNVRLKSSTGAHLDHSEEDMILAGNDLLAMFDIARLNRAAILASRLEARGKTGSLLSEVTAPSITNAAFLENFARIYEERSAISQQLVMTMSQAAVDSFSQSAWQALSDMQAFGFRFALDRVTHMHTDFANLAERGFAFVKLDATALTQGLLTQTGFVPSDQVCRAIAGAGLGVVASGIEDEATRARVFGFGVLLGQGQLFGGPRLVTVPSGQPNGHHAAA